MIRDKYKDIIEPSKISYSENKEDNLNYLKNKLLEEVKEFIETDLTSLEELGDVLEVIDSIKSFQNIEEKELFKIKEEKKEKYGGFYDFLIFEKNEEPEEIIEETNYNQIEIYEGELKKLKKQLLHIGKEHSQKIFNLKKEHNLKIQKMNENFIENLLSPIDTLNNALSMDVMSDFSNKSDLDKEKLLNNMVVGMGFIKDQFNNCFSKIGIEKIDTSGNFNPILHEAISIENNKEIEHNHIIKETQVGYKYNDIVLRPASVIVCKKEENDE